MAIDSGVIHCESLSKRFGKITALKNLTLTIEKGAVFGFLGPNGAGKTTTLRLFAGITKPTTGRVWVGGHLVSGSSIMHRSSIGYLPESPAFYGWMTGREFLEFTAGLYGLDRGKARERTRDLLEMVDLGEAADRRVKTYSRGMMQRLGLAQAMINRPQVLLLDEPASALDPIGRRDMLQAIQGLKGETTVFLSTHILADVERICDRIAIINRGELVSIGTIKELRSRRSKTLFEVEFEEREAPVIDMLRQVPWIRSTTALNRNERSVLQIEVNDLDLAKRELPKLLAGSGQTLLRYELMSASLEDVFVELVEGDKEAN